MKTVIPFVSMGFGFAILLVILIGVGPLGTFIDSLSTTTIKGEVYECGDSKPVSGATVSSQGNGWGMRDGDFVWDKSYVTSVITDNQGKFDLNFKIGKGGIVVSKEGYYNAFDYSNDPFRKVGLLKGENIEYGASTYNCKTDSECYKMVEVDGVGYGWNDCTSPELAPK